MPSVARPARIPTHRPNPEPKTGQQRPAARSPMPRSGSRRLFGLAQRFRRLPRVRQRQHTPPTGRPSPPVKPAPRRCKVVAELAAGCAPPPLRGNQPWRPPGAPRRERVGLGHHPGASGGACLQGGGAVWKSLAVRGRVATPGPFVAMRDRDLAAEVLGSACGATSCWPSG